MIAVTSLIRFIYHDPIKNKAVLTLFVLFKITNLNKILYTDLVSWLIFFIDTASLAQVIKF